MREYKVLPESHPFIVQEHGEPSPYSDGCDALVRFEDGEPVEVLAFDGGEPEDNSFARDWSWVPGALERAYYQGWYDGHRRYSDSPRA